MTNPIRPSLAEKTEELNKQLPIKKVLLTRKVVLLVEYFEQCRSINIYCVPVCVRCHAWLCRETDHCGHCWWWPRSPLPVRGPQSPSGCEYWLLKAHSLQPPQDCLQPRGCACAVRTSAWRKAATNWLTNVELQKAASPQDGLILWLFSCLKFFSGSGWGKTIVNPPFVI